MEPSVQAPFTCYTIAFTVRSGSNLLCDYLTENGFGRPSEHFQHPFGVANRAWYEALQVPVDNFPQFLQTLIPEQSQSGIFGTKLAWGHKNALLEEIQKHNPSVTDLSDIFPNNKLIYVIRKDKIGQAISLWRASQTGSWTSLEQPKQVELEYDFFQLLSCFYSILVEDYLWNHYFDTNDLAVKRIVYEDFITQPRETICDIYQYIQPAGPPINIDDIKAPQRLKMQRDQSSTAIRQLFVDDLYHLGAKSHWNSREPQLKLWIQFFEQAQWK